MFSKYLVRRSAHLLGRKPNRFYSCSLLIRNLSELEIRKVECLRRIEFNKSIVQRRKLEQQLAEEEIFLERQKKHAQLVQSIISSKPGSMEFLQFLAPECIQLCSSNILSKISLNLVNYEFSCRQREVQIICQNIMIQTAKFRDKIQPQEFATILDSLSRCNFNIETIKDRNFKSNLSLTIQDVCNSVNMLGRDFLSTILLGFAYMYGNWYEHFTKQAQKALLGQLSTLDNPFIPLNVAFTIVALGKLRFDFTICDDEVTKKLIYHLTTKLFIEHNGRHPRDICNTIKAFTNMKIKYNMLPHTLTLALHKCIVKYKEVVLSQIDLAPLIIG